MLIRVVFFRLVFSPRKGLVGFETSALLLTMKSQVDGPKSTKTTSRLVSFERIHVQYTLF